MGPIIKPIKNKKLSNLSSFEFKKLLAIPLIPINRPLNIKKIATAKPIKQPPRNEGIGVKLIKGLIIYI